MNSRLTNDIKNLPLGKSCLAACLNPQGRTEALFRVLNISNQEFFLICDSGEKQKIISAFERYKVADRMEIIDRSGELKLLAIIADSQHTCFEALFGPDFRQLESNEVRGFEDIYLARSKRASEYSLDLLIPASSLESYNSKFESLEALFISPEDLKLLRLKAGIAAYPEEANEKIIFSALDLKEAISFKKGCYVGQEVIEKIDAYGKAPYLVRPFFIEGKVDQGALIAVKNEEGLEVGKVISSSYDSQEQRTYLFAEVKNKDKILDSKLYIDNTVLSILGA